MKVCTISLMFLQKIIFWNCIDMSLKIRKEYADKFLKLEFTFR